MQINSKLNSKPYDYLYKQGGGGGGVLILDFSDRRGAYSQGALIQNCIIYYVAKISNKKVLCTSIFIFLSLQKSEESGHYKSNMVRFCYNAISDYECFSSTLEHFLENPLELAWLDLSFNDLSTIDKVLKLVCFYG